MALKPEFKPGEFPDLPEIQSVEIRTKVLTHRSFYARSAHVFEDHVDDPSPDNEKWISFLGLEADRLTLWKKV